MSWSIIVFAYNEEKSLEATIRGARRVLAELSPDHSEIIAVDDGSRDGSIEVLRRLEQDASLGLRLGLHAENRGIGHALRTGYDMARFENVCAIPGDGQFAIDDLLKVRAVAPDEFVLFYRARLNGYSIFRHLVSRVQRLFNFIMVGISVRDVNWVKVYRREHLRSMPLRFSSSLVETEICAKLLIRGVHCRQIETTYLPRRHGTSRAASTRVLAQAARETLRLAWHIQMFRLRRTR